jgi:hypothetical protein
LIHYIYILYINTLTIYIYLFIYLFIMVIYKSFVYPFIYTYIPIYRWFTGLPVKNGDFPWLC